jgi:hypothetical protein
VRAVPSAGLALPAGAAIAAALAAVVLGLALRAPSGGTRHAAQARSMHAAPAYDGVIAGVPLQRATCANWRRATPADRDEILSGLASTVGGASTTGGYGRTLGPAQAVALFDTQCATRATRRFILYVIYARAAGFSPGP